MLASIIITSYNYRAYLADAIESALKQDYPDVEVIIVDDGSSDGSIELIECYENSATTIFKKNSGQSSCFNVGFRKSRGEIVIFLDADDILYENAVSKHVENLRAGVVKSCGYMDVIGADGVATGARIPGRLPDSGDYYESTLRYGLAAYRSGPTSANAWSRKFLEQVMPIPEDTLVGADGYLTAVDRFFGPMAFIHEPVAKYRIHGRNKGPVNFRFDADYLAFRIKRRQLRDAYALGWLQRLGREVDPRQFMKIRDWRLGLMQYTLHLIDKKNPPVPLDDYLAATFRRRRAGIARSAAVTACLVTIRLLPAMQALRLSRYLLNKSVGRNALQVRKS